MAFLIVIAVKTSNLTVSYLFHCLITPWFSLKVIGLQATIFVFLIGKYNIEAYLFLVATRNATATALDEQ
jgi:hypothetical protein